MKRYLIKFTCVATEKNERFGEVHTYYIGKDGGTADPAYIKHRAKVDGYTTKAAALRGLKRQQNLADWETERGWWKDSCELMEIEIEE